MSEHDALTEMGISSLRSVFTGTILLYILQNRAHYTRARLILNDSTCVSIVFECFGNNISLKKNLRLFFSYVCAGALSGVVVI